MSRYAVLVTGGRGFIGSHFVDEIVKDERVFKVIVLDNKSDGLNHNYDRKIEYYDVDITNFDEMKKYFQNIDYVFHFAAKARTPTCIDDPLLANVTNTTGTLHVLEASRINNVERVVLSSSNVVLAGETLYKYTKISNENYANVYNELYNQSVIVLRYSNVYGTRQREDVSGPNVFAALRKDKNEHGKVFITGDGKQSRDFTHVKDIVRANLLAVKSNYKGTLDICTGINTSLNEIVEKYFKCGIEYINYRPGDKKHIIQLPELAKEKIGYVHSIILDQGMVDVI